MAKRIDVDRAHHDLDSSGGAMLVCAYDDDAQWNKYRIEGAISLSALKAQEPSIPKDREIIFYCA